VGGRVDCGHAWLQYVKDWFAEGRCKGADPFGAVADASYVATGMPLPVAHHPIKIQPSNWRAIDCIIDRITEASMDPQKQLLSMSRSSCCLHLTYASSRMVCTQPVHLHHQCIDLMRSIWHV